MTSRQVPFNRPTFAGREQEYIAQAVARGHLSGDGLFTRRCSALLVDGLGASQALLTTNCTHALELAALLLDIQPGDEVIVPTFTFVSTVNAFVLRGAIPVFVDSRPDTLNLDERQLESLITARTRAILPVHYAGIGCEMDVILPLAKRHGIAIVEDNAHGLFGRFRGQLLGSFGGMSTLSFHETKNFTCGEGGALVLNDPAFVARAEVIREKGTNRSQFFRGQVDKYTWVDVGSSYLPSEILAAILCAQLECRSDIQERRRTLFERYQRELGDWAPRVGARLPVVPPHTEPAWHLFYVLMPSLAARQAMIAHLKASGVSSVFHYVPLHSSPMGRRFGGRAGACPVAESSSDRLLRLPFYNAMTDDEQSYVIDAVSRFVSD
ncbi:MAG: dTDP-4-amino-4,6-dideoxygalactose transaminase [Gemmatimonadota bacterium]|nr:dTDP-4-amino-4,6-dideoxygalactose transaminase [Gemmatimonadota bacterium]